MPSLIQWVQGTEQVLPTAMTPIHGSGQNKDPRQCKRLRKVVGMAIRNRTAITHAKPYSVGSGYTNCDQIHGRGPGEIVFRHMSVVQRGVRSRELPPPQLETAWVMSQPDVPHPARS